MAPGHGSKRKQPTGVSAEFTVVRPWDRVGFWLGLILLVTAWMYGPGWHHDFVNYDDPDYVTANPHVTDGVTLEGVKWAFTTGHASNWHPITWISHQLDCTLFGTGSGGPHLVSLFWHLANTVLLFLAVRSLTGARWRSLAVAGLFALHPLHVESVAWVSERKDVLSAFFFFLTLLSYRTYLGSLQPAVCVGTGGAVVAGKSRRWLWYMGALAAFALGLMSKPMLVTVPFLLILLDWWPLGRLGFEEPGWGRRVVWILFEKAPFLALSVGSSVVTFLVQREGGAVSMSLPLEARLGNAVVACVRYMAKMVWPVDLAVLYPHPGHWATWAVCGSLAVMLGISAVAAWCWRGRPWVLTGWCWFLGMLVPVVGIVQVGIQSMADRYTYLPMIGLFIAMAWGAGELSQRLGIGRRAVVAVAVVVMALCAGLGRRQVDVWGNSETLFRQTVTATRDNYLAYNNLGFYYSNQGRTEEALTEYRKSLAINPQYPDALNNMGHALAAQRRHAEAIPYYEAAIRVQPDQVEVRNNYGNSLSDLGRLDEAIEQYRFVIQRNSLHPDANNNLGIALAMKGNLEDAVGHFRTAIQNKKDYASAHSNLGNALAALKRPEAAVEQYRVCLRLNPKDPQAHNNLANVLVEQGKVADAVAEYEEAIRLQPDNPEAHCNLGLSLQRLNRGAEARQHFEEALRLRPGHPEARRALGL